LRGRALDQIGLALARFDRCRPWRLGLLWLGLLWL
jgi:hypothetical protein